MNSLRNVEGFDIYWHSKVGSWIYPSSAIPPHIFPIQAASQMPFALAPREKVGKWGEIHLLLFPRSLFSVAHCWTFIRFIPHTQRYTFTLSSNNWITQSQANTLRLSRKEFPRTQKHTLTKDIDTLQLQIYIYIYTIYTNIQKKQIQSRKRIPGDKTFRNSSHYILILRLARPLFPSLSLNLYTYNTILVEIQILIHMHTKHSYITYILYIYIYLYKYFLKLLHNFFRFVLRAKCWENNRVAFQFSHSINTDNCSMFSSPFQNVWFQPQKLKIRNKRKRKEKKERKRLNKSKNSNANLPSN